MANPTEDKHLFDQKALLQQQMELADLQKLAAEARKAESEAQKAALDAQQAALAAVLPQGETKPLAGTVTVEGDKFGYLAELVAHQCLSEVAREIGGAISNKALKLPDGVSDARILIVPERSVAVGDLPLLQLQNQLGLFETLLEEQEARDRYLLNELGPKREREGPAAGEAEEGIPPGELEGMLEYGLPAAGVAATAVASVVAPILPPVVSAAAVAAPAIASLLADLSGYLKADYTISGQVVELSGEALSAAVAGAIQTHTAYLFNFHFLISCPLISQVQALVSCRHELEKTNLLLKLQQQEPPAEESAVTAATADAAVTETEGLLKAFDDFVKVISTPENETTPPLLLQAALRQGLHEKRITHLLHLAVVSSGGEAVTKRRLFRSGDTAFIGGCAVAYVLVDVEGAVALADTRVGLAQLDLKLSDPTGSKIQSIELG